MNYITFYIFNTCRHLQYLRYLYRVNACEQSNKETEYGTVTGVHIITKIADFLDPKIIFCPNLKKNAPNQKTFSNSTNTFAPNLKKNAPKCPQLKNIFKFHQHICPHLPPIIKKKPRNLDIQIIFDQTKLPKILL